MSKQTFVFVTIIGFIIYLAINSTSRVEAESTTVERVIEVTFVTDTPKPVNHDQKKEDSIPKECKLSNGWESEPDIYQWKKHIQQGCVESGVESDLIASIIYVESRGDRNALSYAGAIGLMQIMPFPDRPPAEQLWKPRINIREGCRILNDALAVQGNLYNALQAYNGWGAGYADLVLAAYRDHNQ